MWLLRHLNFNKTQRAIFSIVLGSLLLIACNGPEQGQESTKADWVKDEILLQLAELRKDVASLKDEVAKLDNRLSNNSGNRRVARVPKQVSLSAGMALGDADAKIAIVEFTDYQCPFCVRHFKTVMPKIKQELISTGKAKYVMYDFPLSFHAQAKSASVAARCAGKQGKYWEMHDVLFDNQRGLANTLYLQTAKSLKLNETNFASCLKDPSVRAAVESSIEYGNQLGVTGTPKFFVGKVNGNSLDQVVVINGAQGFEAFKRAIEKL